MNPPLSIQLNGQPRTLDDLPSPTDLALVLSSLGLQTDRIAVEHNGQIVSRNAWAQCAIAHGDRLEIVHFVGGGSDEIFAAIRSM